MSNATLRAIRTLAGTCATLALATPVASSHTPQVARSTFAGTQATALRQLTTNAPVAQSGRCTSNVGVRGQGLSCWDRTRRVWRVEVSGAGTVLTHGPDQQVLGWTGDPRAENLSPTDASAVNSAGYASIVCARNRRQPHYVAIYARPATRGYQPGLPDQIRSQLQKASAFVDSQTRSSDATRTTRLPFMCDASGRLLVVERVLPTPAGSESFATIVADLRASGYGTDQDAVERYVVYYDDRVGESQANPIGLGGQASSYASDTPGATSANNRGGMFAVAYANIDYHPWWPTLAHELLHTQGAVANGAPEATGAGHCNTDWDIMCYADAGPTGQTTTRRCTYTQLDCGNNTYFATNPPASSWLSTHWNIAATYNRFLHFGASNLDVTAPERPAEPTVTHLTGHSASVSWDVPLDDIATTTMIVQYRSCSCHDWNSRSFDASTVAATLELASTTSYAVQLVAQDAAGNTSLAGPSIGISTLNDDAPPTAPILIESSPESNGATITWTAATDNVAVTRYTFELRDTSGWVYLGEVNAQTFTATISGLQPQTQYVLRIVALDAQANRGESEPFTVETLPIPDGGTGDGLIDPSLWPQPPTSHDDPIVISEPGADTTPPGRPHRPRVTRRTPRAIRISWSADPDGHDVASYTVTWRLRGTTRKLRPIGPRQRFATIPTAARGRYVITVRAIDQFGNRSPAAVLVFTRR